MKTQETLDLEKSLEAAGIRKREYGCEEITIGFKNDGHGDEIVDYMTMDAKGIFRCYELKVSLSDLKTDNKKSFYGDYNYLVVSRNLYQKGPAWGNYIPPYVGILVGTELETARPAKKKAITNETREMLKDSLIRSVYWKMRNYKNAGDQELMKQAMKLIEEQKQKINDILNETDQLKWTYNDYEFYYRMNHQNETWSIAEDDKIQRDQYKARKEGRLNWIETKDGYECPLCHTITDHKTNYCPDCGTDLRKLDK